MQLQGYSPPQGAGEYIPPLSESAYRERFNQYVVRLLHKRNLYPRQFPVVAHKPLDFYRLFRIVQLHGGHDMVSNWKALSFEYGAPRNSTNAGFILSTKYTQFLAPLEEDILRDFPDILEEREEFPAPQPPPDPLSQSGAAHIQPYQPVSSLTPLAPLDPQAPTAGQAVSDAPPSQGALMYAMSPPQNPDSMTTAQMGVMVPQPIPLATDGIYVAPDAMRGSFATPSGNAVTDYTTSLQSLAGGFQGTFSGPYDSSTPAYTGTASFPPPGASNANSSTWLRPSHPESAGPASYYIPERFHSNLSSQPFVTFSSGAGLKRLSLTSSIITSELFTEILRANPGLISLELGSLRKMTSLPPGVRFPSSLKSLKLYEVPVPLMDGLMALVCDLPLEELAISAYNPDEWRFPIATLQEAAALPLRGRFEPQTSLPQSPEPTTPGGPSDADKVASAGQLTPSPDSTASFPPETVSQAVMTGPSLQSTPVLCSSNFTTFPPEECALPRHEQFSTPPGPEESGNADAPGETRPVPSLPSGADSLATIGGESRNPPFGR